MNRRDAIKKAALLLGGAFSAPTLMAMSRWEQNTIGAGGLDFSLTDMQRKIVAEVAEMIIPKTTTSGAKDAGVPAFIEMMVKDCYLKPEHLSFVEGLATLEQDKFLDMDAATRTARLKKLEAETKEKMKGGASKGLPFWRLVKELTLLGYFTSEVGIRDSYEYVQIPSKFELIKLKPNQKAYAY
jgi:hypothetical protein